MVLENVEFVGQSVNEIINALACSLKSRLIVWNDLESILTLFEDENAEIKATPASFRAVDQGNRSREKLVAASYHLKCKLSENIFIIALWLNPKAILYVTNDMIRKSQFLSNMLSNK